jgi:hypothetical protein
MANLFNPDKFVLKGTFNPKLGEVGFPTSHLYLTIMPNIDFKLRVMTKFKLEMYTKKKEIATIEGAIADPFIEQMRRKKELN